MEISGKTQRYHLPVQPAFIDRDDRSLNSTTTGRIDGNEDDVDLSGKGNMLREAIDGLEFVPDIRSDRIAAIRQQIESGTYRIDGAHVVSALMTETEENNDILKRIDGSAQPTVEGI